MTTTSLLVVADKTAHNQNVYNPCPKTLIAVCKLTSSKGSAKSLLLISPLLITKVFKSLYFLQKQLELI